MVVKQLRTWATSRPHVLLVEAPGGAAGRLAVEGVCRERGWPLSATPADADLLVVAGPAGAVDPYVDRVFDQLPGPRARARVSTGVDAAAALDAAREALRDLANARADTRPTQRPPAGMPTGEDMSGHDMGGDDMGGDDDAHAGHDMGGHDMGGDDMGGDDDAHAGHDMGGHDMGDDDMSGHDMSGGDMGGHDMGGHGGHGGHDMGGMEMPAGLGMADRTDDRDGLKLDVLTVPWGPALPWWPAGLTVTTVLQGDVVQEARAEWSGDPQATADAWRQVLVGLAPAQAAVAVRLDALARLLAVAGWDDARTDAERLRDDVLAGAGVEEVRARLLRLTRRVGRSRALRRMSSGLPIGDRDVESTYRGWLADLEQAAAGEVPPRPEPAEDPLALLTRSLTGVEMGTARLVVAALDLQLSGALHREGAGV